MPLAFPHPALAAEGIVLRRPLPGDVSWIVAACSDRELSRYIPGIPYPYSQSDARAFIEDADRAWAGGSDAAFVIAHAAGGDGLGTIGLHLFATSAAANIGGRRGCTLDREPTAGYRHIKCRKVVHSDPPRLHGMSRM